MSEEERERKSEREAIRLREKARLIADLGRWRQEFEERVGHRPSREDLTSDSIAKELFSRFKELNR